MTASDVNFVSIGQFVSFHVRICRPWKVFMASCILYGVTFKAYISIKQDTWI